MGGDRDYGSRSSGGGGDDARGGEPNRTRQEKRVVDLDDFDFVHPRKVDEPALGGDVGSSPPVSPVRRHGYTSRRSCSTVRLGAGRSGCTAMRSAMRRGGKGGKERRSFVSDDRDLRHRRNQRQQHHHQQQVEAMAAVEEVGSAEEVSTPQDQQQQRQEQRNTNVNDDIDAATLEASVPYDLVGKTSHSKDRLVLKDRDGHTIGVIVKRLVHYDRRFDIYGVQPISPSQRPAENQRTKDGDPLYLRARVIGNLKGKLSIDMFSGSNRFRTDVYRVHKLKTGFLEGKTLYFTKQDRMAALLKQGAFPKGVQGPAWDGTIAPGIDPCLMVCLIAILDETNKI